MLAAPKPSPTPTPTPTGTTATAGDTGTGLLATITDKPGTAILILIIATLVICGATSWAWNYRLRPYMNQRGKPLKPLGMIIREYLTFMFKEDKRPVTAKIKPIADKTAWLTGTRLYLALAALIPICALTGLAPWPIALLLLIITIAARVNPVFKARRAIQNRMFSIANAEIRYPRGADLSPWAYVSVQNWRNLTQPGDTVITLNATFQSEDQKTRDKFERNFNGTVSEENTWNYTWESAKNRVTCKPTDFLPKMAAYPGPGNKWNEFVLGTNGNGQSVWDVSSFPHALVCGPTGSGKSVLQRMILFHALAHKDTWRIVGVDPKMVEMGWLNEYDNVLKIALTLEEGVEVVQSVRDEMMRRYDEMSQTGHNHFQKLPDPPPALLCMVDETFNFLAPEGIKSDEGKERDALHAQASTLLGEIARLGRAAGVHLVLATQRPDASVLRGELKNNLDCRIAAGRMDTTPSLMVLDSEAATRLPKIKGRGVIRLGGDIETFQGYFAEKEWMDEFLASQRAAAAGEVPGQPEPEPVVDAPAQKSRGGLKGLAAKAAAAAERRAASAGEEAGDVPVAPAAPPVAAVASDLSPEELVAEFEALAGDAEGFEPLPDSFGDWEFDEAEVSDGSAAPAGDWFDELAPAPAEGDDFVPRGVNPLGGSPAALPVEDGFVPRGVNPLGPPPAASGDGDVAPAPTGLPLRPPPAP